MIRVIADDKIPFLKGILEPYVNISYLPGVKTTALEMKNAEALITRTRTKCTEENLKGSNVKMIATATIGFDHIDTDYCERSNINWTNSPGCNSGSVKQYIATVLATIADKLQIQLDGKTLGIVGVGNVGRKVKDFAKSIGMKVLLNDPPRAEKEGMEEFVDLDDLLVQSDIITFHVPLQTQGQYKTYHLGDKGLFCKCKKEVIIINSSRGEVIDNIDLLDALSRGDIGNVVLDVWENEPNINIKLLEKARIATPHIAGYSADGKANGTAMSVNAISRYFDLPLKDWYPENVPIPENSSFNIDAKGLSFQEVWIKAVLNTYAILEDDLRFRMNPEKFEKLRGSYPLRREFEAFHIKIKNGSSILKQKMNKIGFKHVELI